MEEGSPEARLPGCFEDPRGAPLDGGGSQRYGLRGPDRPARRDVGGTGQPHQQRHPSARKAPGSGVHPLNDRARSYDRKKG